MIALLLPLAHAGYGDPVAGVPTWTERQVHLWTSAARVAPGDFEARYDNGGCSASDFSDEERRAKAPLAYNAGLAAAARAHSADLDATGTFSHDSSDGTDAFTRIARYYDDPTVGENIFNGPAEAELAVLSMWMCSPPHRANILHPTFTELGAGVVGRYLTQDFGGAPIEPPPIMMAVHGPEAPDLGVEILASATAGAVDAWIDGVAYPMEVLHGEPGAAVWRVAADIGEGCHVYHLRAGDAVFPGTGAYGWGDCDWDDAEARWVSERVEPEPEACGCASAPPLWTAPWVVAVFAARRRARR